MLSVLADRTYARLFTAQVVALLGTGLATVALGLLAYDLAGGDAALILGIILTIKMIAYVGVSPFAAALAERLPRRGFLVGLDLVRAIVVLCLPFVTTVWEIFVLIAILQSASAAFTPTFQATIPDVLPEEERYTRALSLSRLAYDLESVASPLLAGLLLMAMSYDALFYGTTLGFLVSAVLVLSTRLPTPQSATEERFLARASKGLLIYLATPRLRGLLALNFTVAACGAMVLVNSVVLVKSTLTLDDTALAITLAAFGTGSMVAALGLPRLLDAGDKDRPVMLGGAALMVLSIVALSALTAASMLTWFVLLAGWFSTGLGFSAVLTPAGRLLRRSAHSANRPAVFAAQFALSHACWLVTYPLAGALMSAFDAAPTFLILGLLGVAGLVAAGRLWPKCDPQDIPHSHHDLPDGHPHLDGSHTHSHDFRIDALHPRWPGVRP